MKISVPTQQKPVRTIEILHFYPFIDPSLFMARLAGPSMEEMNCLQGGLRGAAADAAEKKKSKTAMKKSPKPAAHKKSSKSPAKSKKVESDKKKKSSMKDLETPKSHATPAKSKPTATVILPGLFLCLRVP
jgi:hypothetical protein